MVVLGGVRFLMSEVPLYLAYRFPAKSGQIEMLQGLLPERLIQTLALTVVCAMFAR